MRLMYRIALIGAAAVGLTMGAAGQAEPLKIVASFSILADVVQNVTLNQAEVTSLIPAGADPHTFEPSARDIALLADADIIFVAGANFEESLLRAIESAGANAVIVEASACVPMRVYGANEIEHAEEAEPADDERSPEGAFGIDLEAACAGYVTYLAELDTLKADMGLATSATADVTTIGPLFKAACGVHEQGDDVNGDNHEAGTCDPHIWSNPRNVYYWVLHIRDVLSAADPDSAETYYANAEEYLYIIDDLVRLELEPLLAGIPAERRVLVSNHETLGYFAAAYGFEIAGFVLPGGSAMAEPSAQDLAALIELVRTEQVTAIFSENTLASRVADQVAQETGATVYTLYSDSLSEVDGDAPTYLDYITYNFSTIAAALSE